MGGLGGGELDGWVGGWVFGGWVGGIGWVGFGWVGGWIRVMIDWLQSFKQFFINVSYHILVASLTAMALF